MNAPAQIQNTPRRIAAVSRGELERRWALVREHMTAKGLDAFVTVATSDINLSGYPRWLTDSVGGYRRVAIFYANDLMTVIEHGPAGRSQAMDGKQPGYAGVGELITVAEFPTAHFSQSYEAEQIVATLKRRGVKHVALANIGNMPHGLLAGMKEMLPGASFHDESEFLDRAKALKSAEEIAILRRATAIQDACFARVLKEARPGLRDRDISAIAWNEAHNQGGYGGLIMCGSAPMGEAARMVPDHMQGRTLQKGDHFTILIETGDPGGYVVEVARTVVLGKASNQLREGFEQVKEAQAYTASLLVPGAKCAEIYAKHNAYMTGRGLAPETRLYAHGQGYDLVERPLIRDDETASVEKDMVFAAHPAYLTPEIFAMVCDDFLVTGQGPAERLHKTPQQIFEI